MTLRTVYNIRKILIGNVVQEAKLNLNGNNIENNSQILTVYLAIFIILNRKTNKFVVSL